MMPHLTVVVRCYNEEEHIGKLLSGIMAQTLTDLEIILVDSGSTDATLSIASRFPVKIIPITPAEFSFGRSLNRGCEYSKGEYLVFASAHVYPVFTDWLACLLKPFEDAGVALVYGMQRGDEGARFSEQQIFASWYPERSNYNQAIPFCNNANAAIRRALWEKYPYNEQLSGLEDLDWAQRVAQQGWRIAYAADAEIIHVHRETPAQIYNRYRREAMAMKTIFPSQHFNFWDFTRLTAQNIASDLRAAWGEGRLRRELTSVCAFRVMQFWGALAGFRKPRPLDRQLKQQFYYTNQAARPAGAAQIGSSRPFIDYTSPNISAKESKK